MTDHALRPLARNTTTLLGATVALHLLWSTDLPAPRWPAFTAAALASPPDLTDAITHAVRVIATGVLGYLVLAAVLNLVASMCIARGRAPGVARWAERLAPRWLAAVSLGIVASSTVLSPAAGGATTDDAGGRRSDVLLEVVTGAGRPDDPAARTMLPWATSTTVPAPRTTAPTTSAAAPTPPPTIPDPPRLMPLEPGQLPPPLVIEREAPEELRNHTVLPGEHFWGIAEQVVAERGLTVSVADYWRLLLEANRSRLVDPDDPDLIHPGQVLVLP